MNINSGLTNSTLSGLSVFSIVLTAIILSIYEILFFYLNIVPQIKDGIKSKFEEIEQLLNDKDINMRNDPRYKKLINIMELYNKLVIEDGDTKTEDEIDIILQVLMEKEQELIEQINTYTIATAITIIFILIFVLAFLYFGISNSVGPGNSHIFVTPVLVSIITVGLLICFQVSFYFFGKEYNYPSDNELLASIIENLKE